MLYGDRWITHSTKGRLLAVHEYRRFIQEHLDSRGWKQADLVRSSGLSRQLINSILKDDREHLGQMPDAATLEGIARGFSVPVERVRTAAARSLAGYVDDASVLTPTLQDVHIDALLNEVKRRIQELSATASRMASGTVVADEDVTNSYRIYRFDPTSPDSTWEFSLAARDDEDARGKLREALKVAGVDVDPRSDGVVVVTNVGDRMLLTGMLPQDVSPEREERLIEQLKQRAQELQQVPHLPYAARTAPPGYVSPGRTIRDAQDQAGEENTNHEFGEPS